MSAIDLNSTSSVKFENANIGKIVYQRRQLWPETSLQFYDYILNDEHSYFDIGVKPNYNHIYEAKFCYTLESQRRKWFAILGACASPGSQRFHITKNDAGNFGASIYDNGVNITSYPSNTIMLMSLNCKTRQLQYKIGSGSQSTYRFSGTSGTGNINNYNIYLFTRNTGNQMDTDRKGVTMVMKFYYFKVYDATTGDTLYDFKPCINEGLPGFYDTVNNIFIGSSGPGTVQALND